MFFLEVEKNSMGLSVFLSHDRKWESNKYDIHNILKPEWEASLYEFDTFYCSMGMIIIGNVKLIFFNGYSYLCDI